MMMQQNQFEFPDLTGKKVLVIGLGGGCDCLVAYAFAKDIVQPRTHCGITVYANTIGPRNMKGHLQLAPYIYAAPPGEPVPVTPGDNCYSTTKIECSLPRGQEHSPLIFIVPQNKGNDIGQVFQHNKSSLLPDLALMGFDFIFGVDTGGDSLTGGIDWHDHPAMGRDRQILAILTWLPSVPFLHCMFAPCSDGESSYELMQQSIDSAITSGHYKGQFSCAPMINSLRLVSAPMGPTRTPCIMLQAWDKKLQHAPAPNQDKVIVQRGICPVVPSEWLVTAYVFEWPKNINPDYMLPMAKI